MKRVVTLLPEVCIIEPAVFEDQRGFFFESYQEKEFGEIGITDRFVQDNHAASSKGVLRGLHYQLKHPQAKLCRVILGEVLDVVVDIRRGSPFFGKWESVVLSARNRRQIYVPQGFAHGYLVLSDRAEFLYKCTDFYYPEHERGVRWNDPMIGIDWGKRDPTLSVKDAGSPRLDEIAPSELPEYVDRKTR